MLLEEASSREEVEQALKSGDEELLHDIEDAIEEWVDILDRTWVSHVEYENIDKYTIEAAIEDGFLSYAKSEAPDWLPPVTDEYLMAPARREAQRLHQRGRGEYLEINNYGPNGVEVFPTASAWLSFSGLRNYALIPHSMICAALVKFANDNNIHSDNNIHLDPYDCAAQLEDEGHGGVGASIDADPSFIQFTSDDSMEEFYRDVARNYVNDAIDEDPQGVIDALATAYYYDSIKNRDFPVLRERMSEEDLLDFASRYFVDEDEDVLNELREFAALLTDPGTAPEVMLEITKDDIRRLGIRSGTLYENAPWFLVRLRPSDLYLEGVRMRHCVGDKGMGYIERVKDGDIEIWSLRMGSPTGRPRFTVEASPDADDVVIEQIKGKGNRLPGFARANDSELKFPDEVVLWVWILDKLGIDSSSAADMDGLELLYYNPHWYKNEYGDRATPTLKMEYAHYPLPREWPDGIPFMNLEPNRRRRSFNRPYKP